MIAFLDKIADRLLKKFPETPPPPSEKRVFQIAILAPNTREIKQPGECEWHLRIFFVKT